MNNKCCICSRDANIKTIEANNKVEYNCSYCGKYIQMDSLKQYLHKCDSTEYSETFDKGLLYKVSSWIRELNSWQEIPEIDEIKFKEKLESKDKKIKDKFDLMITDIVKNNNAIFPDIMVKSWIKDTQEYNRLLDKAIKSNFINMYDSTIFKNIKDVTFEGFEYVENLDELNKDSKKIFVAFNFDDDLKPIFNNQVKEAIEETGFTYKIVNQETTPPNQKITDEIVAQIKSSRMIIADFTNSSTNVYFEAGFAMGMKIPVIWTCKKGHKFSFDTGQFPHITWKDADDLKQQLINRIEAIM